MEKPISMTINETKELIINILNNSKLHPSVIELMLKEFYLEATVLANNVAQSERQQYFDEQKENDELEKEPAL